MSDETGETLRTLINTMKGRRTYRDLGDESGAGLGWSRWAQLGNESHALKTIPAFDSIKTIARVLRVSERRVLLAIGREGGLNLGPEESSLIARMPSGTSALTDKQTDLLLEMIREFVDLQRAIEELQATPAKKAPVRNLRAARKATGNEARGPRGGAKRG